MLCSLCPAQLDDNVHFNTKYCPNCCVDARKKSAVRYTQRWQRDNPDRVYEAHIQRKYKIDLKTYRELLTKQNGVCEICKNPPKDRDKLVVDHDHTTKRVRGLLCRGCNASLGQLGDNINAIRAALTYLENNLNGSI